MNVRGVFQAQILSLLSLAILASGCQEFDRLRLILKPEQFPEGLSGPHRVSVKVQPVTGTTLELNGRAVPLDESTELRGLRAGDHRIIVRSPGHQSFATPLKLGTVPHLDLNIQLQKLGDTASEESLIRTSRSLNAPNLTEGIYPASLLLSCASNSPATVDGREIAEKSTLTHIYGVAKCGEVAFRYQYTADGELEVGPLMHTLEFKGERLTPGTFILALPGKHTFLLPRDSEPAFPVEIQVMR